MLQHFFQKRNHLKSCHCLIYTCVAEPLKCSHMRIPISWYSSPWDVTFEIRLQKGRGFSPGHGLLLPLPQFSLGSELPESLEVDPLLVKPQSACGTVSHWITAPLRDPEPGYRAKLHPSSWTTKTEIINMHCFIEFCSDFLCCYSQNVKILKLFKRRKIFKTQELSMHFKTILVN